MAEFGGRREEARLGEAMENFIASALLDFTHMTVLIYLVREGRTGVTASDVAKVTGDSRRTVQGVLDLFLQLEIVRLEKKLLGARYHYQREGPRAHLVASLLKLWEHKEGHSLVLKRVLGRKS
jgi:hypothetical protein